MSLAVIVIVIAIGVVLYRKLTRLMSEPPDDRR
jgi:hypothetical protein